MTDNNIKNKLRFYAQYWDRLGFGALKLKPLSQLYLRPDLLQKITEICYFRIPSRRVSIQVDNTRIAVYDSDEADPINKNTILIFFENFEIITVNHDGKRQNPQAFQVLKIADILKKEGFLLPYLDLTTKDLVGYGWVKSKD